MKVVVIGTRGIPNIQGGVETHCEELYPRLGDIGCDVTIMRRSCYVTPDNQISMFRGVNLIDVYAPHKKSLEAIVHSIWCVVKARMLNPDVVHVHAIGPGLCIPFARLLGLKVVSTNHGPDYDRKKWGKLAKTMLRLGEWCQAHFSNEVIVISRVIADILRENYGRCDTNLVFNGVPMPKKSTTCDYISSLGLQEKKYVLALGRFVEEKGFHHLIEAWNNVKEKNGYRLVIAGDADHEDDYSRRLKALANENNVILTGFIKGDKLNEILTNASLFVLPSSHEGLPISLLEAMSYNIDVLVSDIPANKIPSLSIEDFFRCGDVADLSKCIQSKIDKIQMFRIYDLTPYNWDVIARQTLEVYKKVL